MMDKDNAPKTKQQDKKQPVAPSSKPDAEAPPGIASEPTQEAEPDDPFDFGGLPARNLKKNLGCGG